MILYIYNKHIGNIYTIDKHGHAQDISTLVFRLRRSHKNRVALNGPELRYKDRGLVEVTW